jgi:acyl carrier protein
MRIHLKTIKIFKKILNLNISQDKDLKIKILNVCDSLKFLELLIEVEKNLKIKIKNKNIKTIKDINNLF